MFRPKKVHHAKILFENSEVEGLLSELHEANVCEIKKAETKLLQEVDVGVREVDDVFNRLDRSIKTLEPYREIVQPGSLIKTLFKPAPPKFDGIELRSNEKVLEETKNLLEKVEPAADDNLAKIAEINTKIAETKQTIHNLSIIPQIKTSLLKSTENIKIFVGIAPLDEKEKPKINALVFDERIDKTQVLRIVATVQDNAANINKKLHEIGFDALELIFEERYPKEIIEDLNKNVEGLKADRRQYNKVLEELSRKYRKTLNILFEEISVSRDKIYALKSIKTSDSFSVMEAWIPDDRLNEFRARLEKVKQYHYMEVKEREDAPTIYDNPKLIKPFEAITNLYSPPKYNRFDPTPIVAFTFAFFFGFMLTDFIYGILIAIMFYFILKGAGKYNESVKQFSVILIIFGISTLIMGVIFGSYFGDFFQRIGINLPVPINAMTEVLKTLIIVLVIGALHMGIGLFCGFKENLKVNGFNEAMSKQGIWLLFLAGLVFIVFKGFFMQLGLILIGLAVISQLVYAFIEGGPITSVLSIFNFSGFLGDLFSYARLMALGVGTAGIALAVNFLTLLAIDMVPFIGIIFAIIIFVIGHLFNMAMNGLGAFIHSTRLHFLEFFQKFYFGGGRLYKPFYAERKSTKIIDMSD